MRTRAIVNPRSAGGRTGRRWPELENRLRADLPDLDSVLTDARGSARELTRRALAEGVEQILAVGGDGTVNEVVNGFFADDAQIRPDAVLAIMMLGTGGDFRRSLGIGADVEDYVDHLLHGSVREIDVGRVELTGADGAPLVRYFDNIASFGASGELVDRMNRGNVAKAMLPGKLAFYWQTIRTLIAYDAPRVHLTIDGAIEDELRPAVVAVCNGQFFGGGMWAAPKAELDDGLFDVVLVEEVGPWGFIRDSGKWYSGSHHELSYVRSHRGKRVVATLPEGGRLIADLDGETPGHLPATYEIVPGALRVRCKERTP